mmetsp:Transcript_389/g.1413  ORF Transcript_389/g.1413 Transcript_389/m.1413 type:complete len:264 (-) Transcript_389:84-875(-)
MAGANVNFVEALQTLKSMFPELDTVTIRDALDSKGGHMESAVEDLLQLSRRQRGMGGGMGGRGDGYGDDDGAGRGGYSDEPPRHSSMGRGGQGSGQGDYYSAVPPPEEEGSLWSWLTGEDDEPRRGGSANYTSRDDEDTFTWLANSANFYAGEVSRTVKSMTDALAEELLGPAEDEEGDIIEEEDASIRGNGEVVTGGAIKGPGRRSKKKEEEAPKPKPKPKRLTEEEEDDEDDVIGGVLNLLGLEDDEEEEVYVRRDNKKDK